VHLLRYVVKCAVTDSPFNIRASCSKCPPSAWITFLTRVTRELVTLQSTAVLWSHESEKVSKQMEGTSNSLSECSTANL
jgi:hypothetical protein